jgi:SpoVK/Ycf46/Vps4 family AAA+-type ATPase
MPTIDQLSRLFKALSNGDSHGAEQIAIQIASDEEKKGHRTAAQLLKGSLVPNGTKSLVDEQRRPSTNGSSAILMSALSSRSAAVALEDVYLRKDARTRLQEVVKEFKNKDCLKSLGIRRRSKLILHGPPGCGKSLAAQALANELKLPLFVVRFDSIIGAYLGQTATHLRQLFQFAEATQCVLLFDEIDALGKRRGSPTDVGELDRIVIALMQELELSELQGFVFATSNIPGSLDPALWRRFDLAVHFPGPSKEEILRFARSKAKSFQLSLSSGLLQRVSSLTSYADVERAIEDAARRLALRSL